MSTRLSIPDIVTRKGATKLVVLTCYTAPMAQLMDGEVDILLVGDSLATVIYGMENTLHVPLDIMIAHGKAVAAHARQTCVVVDLPFGSYQETPAQAFRTAARVLAETGAQAVKLEGGVVMADTIRFLVERGVPVMGHVGLMPQYYHTLGGYRTQGRNDVSAERILRDAKAVAEAGAFAVVLEGVAPAVADIVTQALAVPTIGIGASPACDGQVLVLDDMLGITPRVPGFVKRYAQLADSVREAVRDYAKEVQNGTFPDAQYCFPYKK